MTPTRNLTRYDRETVNREPLVIFCRKRNDHASCMHHERGPSQTRSKIFLLIFFSLPSNYGNQYTGCPKHRCNSIMVHAFTGNRFRKSGHWKRTTHNGGCAVLLAHAAHACTLLPLGVNRQTGNCGLRPRSTVCRKEAASGWSGFPNTIFGCDHKSKYFRGILE
jgi:hypothetical protein